MQKKTHLYNVNQSQTRLIPYGPGIPMRRLSRLTPAPHRELVERNRPMCSNRSAMDVLNCTANNINTSTYVSKIQKRSLIVC